MEHAFAKRLLGSCLSRAWSSAECNRESQRTVFCVTCSPNARNLTIVLNAMLPNATLQYRPNSGGFWMAGYTPRVYLPIESFIFSSLKPKPYVFGWMDSGIFFQIARCIQHDGKAATGAVGQRCHLFISRESCTRCCFSCSQTQV